MGKKMIPPNDPARLAMVMDDKRRIYGVDVDALERQKEARKIQEQSDMEWRQHHDRRYQRILKQIDDMYRNVGEQKREKMKQIARELEEQMQEKKSQMRQEAQQCCCCGIEPGFFSQFGASHR